jgi:hypothetical protein
MKNTIALIFLIFSSQIFSAEVAAELTEANSTSITANKNVVVLEFDGKNISAQEASILADAMRGELVSTKHFTVHNRGNKKLPA